MNSCGHFPGLVSFPALMRLRPAPPGASIAASAAPYLLHRAARSEPDLDLRDLELVHAEGAKGAHQPFAEPIHAGRFAIMAAVGRTSDSSSPAIAR